MFLTHSWFLYFRYCYIFSSRISFFFFCRLYFFTDTSHLFTHVHLSFKSLSIIFIAVLNSMSVNFNISVITMPVLVFSKHLCSRFLKVHLFEDLFFLPHKFQLLRSSEVQPLLQQDLCGLHGLHFCVSWSKKLFLDRITSA